MSNTFAPWGAATRCIGSATPGAVHLLAWLAEEYSHIGWSGGIYGCRRISGTKNYSVHSEGRAIDWMLPTTKRGKEVGHEIVSRLAAKGRALGIQCIIYDRTIWSASSPNGRPYKGAHPHYDHLHIELTREAGRVLNLATIRHHLVKEVTPVASSRDFQPKNGRFIYSLYHANEEVAAAVNQMLKGELSDKDVLALARYLRNKKKAFQSRVVPHDAFIKIEAHMNALLRAIRTIAAGGYRLVSGYSTAESSLDALEQFCDSLGVLFVRNGPTFQFHATLTKTKQIEQLIANDPYLFRNHGVSVEQGTHNSMGVAKKEG